MNRNRRPLPVSQSSAHYKIQDIHLAKLAVVYIRQSGLQQMQRHPESARIQYALVERAIFLGWPRERVLVIDEDQGRSATSAEGRFGFQRLVAEVGLNHVGLILGVEMSRLARSNGDWYRLLDICAIFSTLLADVDGLYDPSLFNDRLLLGLKGCMSEAEIHVLKQRLLDARSEKAERGELLMLLPMGYVHRPSGEVIKDPDEQAQRTIELVFELFERLNTINAVLRHLVVNRVKMPIRLKSGPDKGMLEWHRPSRPGLQGMLHNPIYAGAYVWGRRPVDPRRQKPGRPATGRTVEEMGQWQVFLKDQLPAYISWERFERNQKQLQANSSQGLGVARQGEALLPGLLLCGRCGCKMSVHYQSKGQHRYECCREADNHGGQECQSLAGGEIDRAVATKVLEAIAPAGLELSLGAARNLESERRRERELWEKRLKRAHQEADRAFRQFNLVEPENRQVARALERKYEELLNAQQLLQEDFDRYLSGAQPVLSEAEREVIRSLAQDIPTLWNASSTRVEERQQIMRLLIERVLVRVEGKSESVDVEIHWAGEHRTQLRIRRKVGQFKQLSNYDKLLARVAEEHGKGLKPKKIAAQLNSEGWHSPRKLAALSEEMVVELLMRQGLNKSKRTAAEEGSTHDGNEWTLNSLANQLGVSRVTVYLWLKMGILTGRREEERHRQWVILADATELERLKAYRDRPKGKPNSVKHIEH